MKYDEAEYTLPDFSFGSGEMLPALRIHCTTLGKPRRDKEGVVRNAVLILHGTGGSGHAFLREQFANVLFGPDQPLDASRFYIILPDAIGHGKSSKPSDGMGGTFPRYGYLDMLQAQYRLLTHCLQVDHVRLVMGSSMGGMHTWLWGIHHPLFMDALLPLACLPVQIAGRNRVMRRMIMDAINLDPDWKQGNYVKQPRGLTTAACILMLMSSSPLQWRKLAPTQGEADAFFEKRITELLSRLDATDMLYQFAASADYNPEPDLEKIVAPLWAINSADDQINLPELGIMEEQIKRVRWSRYTLLPISEETIGHSTHSLPRLWHAYLSVLLGVSEAEEDAWR